MVQAVEIKNFRGFENFKVEGIAQINVIVGDNAVGKTALLEALWLTMSGHTQQPISLKQWRGLDVSIQQGNADSVAEAIYADLFHDPSSSDPISIKIAGDGFQNRELVISRSRGDLFVPTTPNRHTRRAVKKGGAQIISTGNAVTVPISLTWRDERGIEHVSRVLLSPTGLTFEGTGEKIPNSFMFAAQVAVSSAEAANHYSALRKYRATSKFREVFLSVFDWIKDISVETVGNSPVLLADVPWAKQLLPLPALSGGTNRVAAILLALAQPNNGMVLVDEVESGIYHARQKSFATALIEMSRAYKSQLITTTHSDEWIDAFLSVVQNSAPDIAFWRMYRDTNLIPRMRRFTVAEYRTGRSAGEMR